jgi:hypothetical protein
MSGARGRTAGTGRLVLLRSPAPPHHTQTHTHLVRGMQGYSRDSLYSDGNVYPVYLEGQTLPAIHGHSPWFSLTAASPTLKGKLFPDFFDSEMGSAYKLKEDPRD